MEAGRLREMGPVHRWAGGGGRKKSKWAWQGEGEREGWEARGCWAETPRAGMHTCTEMRGVSIEHK